MFLNRLSKISSSKFFNFKLLNISKMSFSNLNLDLISQNNKQISDNLNNINKQLQNINKIKDEETWRELEANIINNIHHIDADGYTDILAVFASNNKGSEVFWDLLSRKVFDFDFDLVQYLSIQSAIEKTSKADYYIMDPIIKKLYPLFQKHSKNELLKKLRI